MEDKIALVTGANSGIGKAAATALVEMGIHVVMLCRNKARGEAARKDVIAQSGGKATLMLCNLGSMADIKRFCLDFKTQYQRLDVLINNASTINFKRKETEDGLESNFGVSHIGHFLLTTSLLDIIKATPNARIVVMGSVAHRFGKIDFDDIELKKGYTVSKAYSRAKLCNLLFTKALAKRLDNSSVTVNCVHPGTVATNIVINTEKGIGKLLMKLLYPAIKTPVQGADTAVYVATSEACKDISGEYFVNRKIAKTSARAQDDALAERLWETSEAIIRENL